MDGTLVECESTHKTFNCNLRMLYSVEAFGERIISVPSAPVNNADVEIETSQIP